MGTVVSLEARRLGRRLTGRERAGVSTAFFFDLADPGTYLAAERVDRLFPGVRWTPAALSGLPPRSLQVRLDAEAEARAAALGMPLVWPDGHPAPRRAAMRAAAHAA